MVGGSWDGQRQRLRPEYLKYLTDGAVSPDFCFPLQTGREWGNGDVPWRVEPAREGVASFLPAEYGNAIHIFSNHFGSGGWKDVWFQKGVGVVGEHSTLADRRQNPGIRFVSERQENSLFELVDPFRLTCSARLAFRCGSFRHARTFSGGRPRPG